MIVREFTPLNRSALHSLIEGTLNLSADEVNEAIPLDMMGRLLQTFNDLRVIPTSAWTNEDMDEELSERYDIEVGFRKIYVGDRYSIHQRDGWGDGDKPTVPSLIKFARQGAPSLYFETEAA